VCRLCRTGLEPFQVHLIISSICMLSMCNVLPSFVGLYVCMCVLFAVVLVKMCFLNFFFICEVRRWCICIKNNVGILGDFSLVLM
jgi:hypothetical protein